MKNIDERNFYLYAGCHEETKSEFRTTYSMKSL